MHKPKAVHCDVHTRAQQGPHLPFVSMDAITRLICTSCSKHSVGGSSGRKQGAAAAESALLIACCSLKCSSVLLPPPLLCNCSAAHQHLKLALRLIVAQLKLISAQQQAVAEAGVHGSNRPCACSPSRAVNHIVAWRWPLLAAAALQNNSEGAAMAGLSRQATVGSLRVECPCGAPRVAGTHDSARAALDCASGLSAEAARSFVSRGSRREGWAVVKCHARGLTRCGAAPKLALRWQGLALSVVPSFLSVLAGCGRFHTASSQMKSTWQLADRPGCCARAWAAMRCARAAFAHRCSP